MGARGGASTIEFAIVFPFFFLLLLGIFDFARACWLMNSLQFAVAQGARYVMTSPSGSSRPTAANCATWTPGGYQTSITTYMRTQLANASVATATPSAVATVSCSPPSGPPVSTVVIGASYTFTFMLTSLVGLFRRFPSGLPMHQQAIVSVPLS